jgi:hypothetical protein
MVAGACPCTVLIRLIAPSTRVVGGQADRGAAGRRPTVSAEARPMPWSDRRYTRVCQRTLSYVVSTTPMEVLAGGAIGGVCHPM